MSGNNVYRACKGLCGGVFGLAKLSSRVYPIGAVSGGTICVTHLGSHEIIRRSSLVPVSETYQF
jgi:hypothetical protein